MWMRSEIEEMLILEAILYLSYIVSNFADYVKSLRNGTLGRLQHT
ncbi:MAG: hypothetical protein ACPK85_14025 [Methanosarcina sp.]